MHSHAWPNYSRYRRGLPSVLPSSMDGLWSGEYVAQEEKEVRWPELFLYSKSDFYLPYEHLEQEVLAKRKALGRDYRTVRQVLCTSDNVTLFLRTQIVTLSNCSINQHY